MQHDHDLCLMLFEKYRSIASELQDTALIDIYDQCFLLFHEFEAENSKRPSNILVNITAESFVSSEVRSSNFMRSIKCLNEYLWEMVHLDHWKHISLKLRSLYSFSCYMLVCYLDEAIDINVLPAYWVSIVMQQLILIADKGILLSGIGDCNDLLISFIESRKKLVFSYSDKEESVRSETMSEVNTVLDYDIQAAVLPLMKKAIDIRNGDLSEDEFCNSYMMNSKPVIIRGEMDGWRALQCTCDNDKQDNFCRCWRSLDYIKRACGCRTVPVELGATYLSEESSQELMTVREFIENYIMPFGCDRRPSKSSVGYLAQHQIFAQIPCLRGDISIPDYCTCLLSSDLDILEDCADVTRKSRDDCSLPAWKDDSCSNCHQSKLFCFNSTAIQSAPEVRLDVGDDDVILQLWFGSVFTMSPLHHDPFHNLLSQIVGYKYVRLYAADQTQYLYPRSGAYYNNSEIDLGNYDIDQFPLAQQAAYYECVLGPGEMLYIPRHMWHWVVAIDEKRARQLKLLFSQHYLSELGNSAELCHKSTHCMSVSFWWGPRIELDH